MRPILTRAELYMFGRLLRAIALLLLAWAGLVVAGAILVDAFLPG